MGKRERKDDKREKKKANNVQYAIGGKEEKRTQYYCVTALQF